MPKEINEGNLDIFSVYSPAKIKMSDCADNLTQISWPGSCPEGLFLLGGRLLKILDRSSFAFVDLFLDFTLLCFGFPRRFRRNDKD